MAEPTPPKPAIEMETALMQLGGDTELLAETARMFLDDGPAMVAALRDAVLAGDMGGVERRAHRLKGSLLALAALPAADLALALERMGRQGAPGRTRDTLTHLERELRRLEDELRALAGTADAPAPPD